MYLVNDDVTYSTDSDEHLINIGGEDRASLRPNGTTRLRTAVSRLMG